MDIVSQNFAKDLQSQIQEKFDCIFLLLDSNTEKYCLPKILQNAPYLADCQQIIISDGEENKTLQTIEQIWNFLSTNGATRQSLLLNIGGGMVCDLGGFAAATFKRGINFINIPTTLLAAVDAATGGKTGFNFLGLKNEIGVFAQPQAVIINTSLFSTLNSRNLYSGFAEMLKYGYINSENLLNETFKFINTNAVLLSHCGLDQQSQKYKNEIAGQACNDRDRTFVNLIRKNLEIKQYFLEIDHFDKKERKALNFGHTFGHSFEAFSHQTDCPILHGEAVAWGMVCELFLSHILLNFNKIEVVKLYSFVKENYPKPAFCCNDLEQIYELMQHDKKNSANRINFTLLSEIGSVKINQTATKEQIFECLEFLC
ncbi:MAG: 3-dehydroquinate synthase [Prevotellaceae bacterium]|jgi:3-dehydroquinate synthase|nr:3-dehydroquinate synthase [Prevotellaceae bacterium]